MIDSKKISLIHLAKKNLAMTDDDYRALLLRAAGVESSTCLDAVGFAAVMVEFGRLGFVRPAWLRVHVRQRTAEGTVSPRQPRHLRSAQLDPPSVASLQGRRR